MVKLLNEVTMVKGGNYKKLYQTINELNQIVNCFYVVSNNQNVFITYDITVCKQNITKLLKISDTCVLRVYKFEGSVDIIFAEKL